MNGKTELEIGLSVAILAVIDKAPSILVIASPRENGGAAEPEGLPSGPFDPLAHRTFEIGLRNWVKEQTALSLGYVEQLYTFGDRGRHAVRGDSTHVVSVGYLALARPGEDSAQSLARSGAAWRPWYDYFPWEDWRTGRPPILDEVILPALQAFAREKPEAHPPGRAFGRMERLRLAFGDDDLPWDEERALDRYELLYEAGLVAEAMRDGRPGARSTDTAAFGAPMRHDNRRILATAISRLRGKLKYRPVIFELVPPEFTLTELQRTVEAISGRHLHKQNFRRLVESNALVEPTGASSISTGGRPAALFRYRREVATERPASGLRFGLR